MRGGGLVYAVAILLFIGYLAVTAQCRFDAGTRSSYLEDHAAGAATMVNTTSSLDESKLSIKFCIKAGCSHADGLWKTCFCCDILPDKKCFSSEDECRNKCPTCHPECPPASSMELHA
ncbi:hypothetical protein ZWY2020_026028 [Hordeum vulgare]|nr:hypothetical protein ZWY2020_026028 [Hordeum vulgare]